MMEQIELSGATFRFRTFGDPAKRIYLAAELLCETRGHEGFRPCEFCAMQCGIADIELQRL